MYLLDNNNKNIVWDDLKVIYGNIDSIDKLRDDNLLNNNKLDEILYKMSKNIIYTKSEDTIKNLYNLFSNPPLNMSKESIDFMFDNNLKIKNFINNKNDSFVFQLPEINKIFNEYKKRIDIEIKKSNNDSYDIVGMIHKNLVPLCYGNKIYNKKDMDELLFYVDSKKDRPLNNDLDFEKTKKELMILLDKVFIDKDKNNELKTMIENNEINLVMKTLSDKISDINDKTFYNSNRDLLNFYKRTLNTKIKDNIIKEISSLPFNEEKEEIETLIINGFITKDIYSYLDSINTKIEKNMNDLADIMLNVGKFKLDEPTKSAMIAPLIGKQNNLFILKETIINLIKSKEDVENLSYKSYINKVKSLESDFIYEQSIKNGFKLSTNIEDLKIKQNNEYNDILESYQKINKSLLSNIDYKNNHINLSISSNNKIKEIDKSNIYELFKIKDINKYNLNDVKQLFLLLNSDNKTIYKIFKETDLLKNIEKNVLFLNIFKNKYNTLNEDVLKRTKYLYDVLVIKSNLKELFKEELTLDVEKYIFKAHNDISKSFNKDTLDALEKEFNNYKNNDLFKNKLNILMGILIYSIDVNELKLDENKFNKLSEILKINKNNLLKNKDLLNTLEIINDKWLSWSLIYGREIKDHSLVEKISNPLTFDFTKHQTIKQIIETKKQRENFDHDFYHVYRLFEKLNEKRLNSTTLPMLYQAMENIPENMKSYFISACKHLNNISDSNVFKNYYKPELNKYYKNFYSFINNTIKTFYFEKQINFSNQETFIDIYKNVLKSKNKDDKIFKNLDLLKELFVNDFKMEIKSTIDTTKKIGNNKLTKYIKNYKDFSTKYNIDDFDIKNSKIPIIEKNIGNGYSYKVITAKNFDIMLAGEQSDCCMTLNGAGWNIYKHIFEKPESSMIFNVYKNGKVVANSWTWLQNNQLTFDNIEVLGNEVRDNIKKAYLDYSVEVLQKSKNINLISYGLGNGDIRDFGFGNNSCRTLDNYKNYYGHGDSNSQKVIMGNKTKLTEGEINMIINLCKDHQIDSKLINYLENLNNNDNNLRSIENCQN